MKLENCNELLRVTLKVEKAPPTWKSLQMIPTSEIKWKQLYRRIQTHSLTIMDYKNDQKLTQMTFKWPW